ncbi:MAG: toll/interleukin-1 receptor domain-containing protein [Anaerolineae bacterium]|nr:toll/interleukin-1 receptor domain-containing protein [Anaerolineae bacterium]
MERVDAVISYLHEKRRRDGTNALVLLLRVLSSQIDSEDDRHHQLASLANELEQVLGDGISPAPHPAISGLTSAKPSAHVSEPAAQTDFPSATREKSPEEQPKTKSKDFFISYNRHDRQWAEWIAWQMEAAGYTTVIQAWDFRPGGNFVADMQRATTEAERTLAVLSPDYLASSFTQPEWNAAFAQDPTGEQGLLLPVRVRECELKGLLPQIVYIDLVGQDQETAKIELLNGIKRGRAKPMIEPHFPGEVKHPISEQPAFPGKSFST